MVLVVETFFRQVLFSKSKSTLFTSAIFVCSSLNILYCLLLYVLDVCVDATYAYTNFLPYATATTVLAMR